jgi:hypothetical protein
MYDPEVGVWMATDPAGQFWSGYTYTGGNPVFFIDPFGLSTWAYNGTVYAVFDDGDDGVYEMANPVDDMYMGDYLGEIPMKEGVSTLMDLDQGILDAQLADAYQRLQTDSHSPEGKFDTDFFSKRYENTHFRYGKYYYRADEVNYIGIGEYEAHAGRPLLLTAPLIHTWKSTQYPETRGYTMHRENCIFWATYGYYWYGRQ